MQDDEREGQLCAHRRTQEGWQSVSGRWPDPFSDLVRELRADRGRPALVEGSAADAGGLIRRLEPLVDEVVSVGERIAAAAQRPTAEDLLEHLDAGSTLLRDIEALFTPALQIEVVSQLRRTAQRTALVVAWPGEITGGRLSYSRPGRADHMTEPARDLIVLRPISSPFPDEVPYIVERYPA